MSLRLDAISVRAGARMLFRDVTIQVGAGQVVTLMGPSGIGKSSLLAYVTGTLPPGLLGEGTVRLHGEDIGSLPAHRRRLGMLFQDDLLFPHMTVGGNLAFALDPGLRGRAARRAAVDAALARAGLDGLAGRDPASLSGGQRARVALLRVLLSRPRALLLDEPFGGLDATLRDRMRRLVFATAAEHGLPVLLVTHDPADAAAAGGPVVRLNPPAAIA